MARDQGAAKGNRIAATAKATRRAAKTGDGKAGKTPRAAASGDLPMPADISQDVLHGRVKPIIYAALTKRLRSTS